MLSVTTGFDLFERGAEFGFHFIEQNGAEGIAEERIGKVADVAPDPIVTVVAFGDETMNVGIPFEVPVQGMKNHNKTEDKVHMRATVKLFVLQGVCALAFGGARSSYEEPGDRVQGRNGFLSCSVGRMAVFGRSGAFLTGADREKREFPGVDGAFDGAEASGGYPILLP